MNGFVGRARRAPAQTAIMVKNVTSTRRGNLALAAAFLALAAAFLVGAVILGAIAASRLEAISRLREHGLTANATTTNVVTAPRAIHTTSQVDICADATRGFARGRRSQLPLFAKKSRM